MRIPDSAIPGRLQVYGQAHLSRCGVGDFRRLRSRQDRRGQLSGLATNVLTTRERECQQCAQLSMTL